MYKKSFIKKLSGLIRIQITAMILLFCVITVIAYQLAEREMRNSAESFLSLYGNQLENRLERIDRVAGIILDNNVDLQMIQSADYLTRHYSSVSLQSTLSDILTIDTNAESAVVAESQYGICLTSNSSFPYEEQQRLNEYTMTMAENGKNLTGGWKAVQVEDKSYLCRSAVQGSRILALYVSVDALLNTVSLSPEDDRDIYFGDSGGRVFGAAGAEALETDLPEYIGEVDRRGMLVNQYSLLNGKYTLHCFEKTTWIYRQMSGNMGIMLAAVAALYLFTLYLKRNVRQSLIMPMESLRRDMERIQQGEYELRINENSDNEEFDMLAGTFNKLLDEIIHLRIQYYEKRLELQEADQKYIRLQLRPHFFLNAMTTVSGLSTQGRNQEIQKYILALSKNIRYMFSSGMHTVPVKDEIQHVENYFEMQELKYPNCVFTYVDLPEELQNWRIPQMLIHTVVENEYRYAVSRSEVLMMLIRISEAMFENEKMLLIEIEDNGKGYPQQVLDYMNDDNSAPMPDGTRVGLWSIRRIMELMYDRKGLFTISNVTPHGAMSRIYVPYHTVHEVHTDKPEGQ